MKAFLVVLGLAAVVALGFLAYSTLSTPAADDQSTNVPVKMLDKAPPHTPHYAPLSESKKSDAPQQ